MIVDLLKTNNKRLQFQNDNLSNLLQRELINKSLSDLDNLKFIKNEDCVQGFAGLANFCIRIPNTNHNNNLPNDKIYPLFWKFSQNIDCVIEHEFHVGYKMNDLIKICPHFVQYYAKNEINLPKNINIHNFDNYISKYFSKNETIFDYKRLYSKPLIFTEQLENYPLLEMIQDNTFPIKEVISQMIQVFLAIHIAQITYKFVHYDLHYSNILLQKCNNNTLFLYVFENDIVLIPTNGYYPVIIDYGNAHINNSKYISSWKFYSKGIQPSFNDVIQDIHFLLFPSLNWYKIDNEKDYTFIQFLTDKLANIFRRLPIITHSRTNCGEKKLPHDLDDFWYNIISNYSSYFSEKSFISKTECVDEFLDIFNMLIRAPFKLQNFNESFVTTNSFAIALGHHFDNFLINFDLCVQFTETHLRTVLSKTQKLFLFKHIFEQYLDENTLLTNNNATQKLGKKTKIKNKTQDVFHDVYNWNKLRLRKTFFDILNIEEMFEPFQKAINSLREVLSMTHALFFVLEKEHISLLTKIYSKTSIQNSLQLAYWLNTYATQSFEIQKTDELFIWNIKEKNKQRLFLTNLTDDQIENINILPMKCKGKQLFDYCNLSTK